MIVNSTQSQSIESATSLPPIRIAVAASFTAEPVQSAFEFWAHHLGVHPEVRFAPYNQLLQTLHDPNSQFARNQAGLNLLLLRLEDLAQGRWRDPQALSQIEENFQALLKALAGAQSRFQVPTFVVMCPESPEFMESPERVELLHRSTAAAGSALRSIASLHLLLPEDIFRQYPVTDFYSEEGERLGKIPFTDLYFSALATSVMRVWDALTRSPFKAIAVDCDNTLWEGICGEDGPENVTAGPGRIRLHEFLLAQREAGMLLCIASKNNEADVLETFSQHPEWPLRPHHFAACRINWEPKPVGLAALAAELNIGIDSFLFLDDNPKECAEMNESLPDVTALALPVKDDAIAPWLDQVWAFDHPVVTEEDRKRSAYYEQNRAYSQAAQSAHSLEEFMENLGLTLNLAPVSDANRARVAQLTQRTNQFNTTTIRRTEAEIEALDKNPRWQVTTASVADRFGEYGLTGVLIAEQRPTELYIDSMLLSCRVLGRGVEHKLLRCAARNAQDLDLEYVTLAFQQTQRNRPAEEFLDSIAGAAKQEIGGQTLYRFEAEQLAKLKWHPRPVEPRFDEPVQRSSGSRRPRAPYAAIATQFHQPQRILGAIRNEGLEEVPVLDEQDAPKTETERRLARIWAELLKHPRVKLTDNFFDLGGHSLLAVLLLTRIKEEFGVDLSVDDVYSGHLTLGGLARTVEARELGELTPEEYELLVKEIEGLSDEEVQALLEQEENEGRQA